MATTTPAPLKEYVDAAMRHAQLQWLPDDGLWLADFDVSGLEGAFAAQPTREWALAELREVLEGWLELSVEDGDPIPEIDGLRLAVEGAA